MPNAAEIAFAAWQADEEKERQRNVLLARRYYDGQHETFLTTELRRFLNVNDDHEFNLNVARAVVDAVTERLILLEVGTAEEAKQRTPLQVWADSVWSTNDLDITQDPVHTGTGSDGEYFVFVEWDAVEGRIVMTPWQRYTDADVDGDGEGCKAHYPNDNPHLPMEYASKRWVENLGQGKARNRCNLYYPDRVEKYEVVAGGLVPFREEMDTAWPLAWVDSAGNPLGIPIVHFRNGFDVRPEHWDAIPLQRSINKTVLDLLAAGDASAFQLYVALGFIPTTDGQPPKADGSNRATVGPGQFVGTTRTPAEADLKAVPGADLTPMIGSIEAQMGWLAVITSTPKSRLTFGKQVAAEGTLQQQNEGLFAKCRKRKAMLDRAWVKAFDMARRIANTFGNAGLSEDVVFVPHWEELQARDVEEQYREWEVKATTLKIPLEALWAEAGYTTEQIEAMKGTDEYKQRGEMALLGLQATVQGEG